MSCESEYLSKLVGRVGLGVGCTTWHGSPLNFSNSPTLAPPKPSHSSLAIILALRASALSFPSPLLRTNWVTFNCPPTLPLRILVISLWNMPAFLQKALTQDFGHLASNMKQFPCTQTLLWVLCMEVEFLCMLTISAREEGQEFLHSLQKPGKVADFHGTKIQPSD